MEVQNDMDLKKASDEYLEKLNQCSLTGTEEEFNQCELKALHQLDDEKERLKSILNLRKRACLKMPTIPF